MWIWSILQFDDSLVSITLNFSREILLHSSHDESGKKVILIQMLNKKKARIETIHVDKNEDVDVKKILR
jgi:hypothetical protein